MISLGKFDVGISPEAIRKYLEMVKQLTGFTGSDDAGKLRGDQNNEVVAFEPVTPDPSKGELSVAEVQGVLKNAGFFPFGQIDGICGYRTTAAIRFFQEYVRTVEKDESIGSPDGMLGTKAFGHIRRWRDGGLKADWIGATSERHQQGIALLNAVKQRCLQSPNRMLQMVDAYTGKSDTLKVSEWDFNPEHIHLIGIRKNTPDSEGQFNDVFFLLIRGLVFAFNGSTDPGSTTDPKGFPFLTNGQHLYRFGWHGFKHKDRIYQALKPRAHGVLVVRSKDRILNEQDLAGGLEANGSINVHWGGEGFSADIGTWSEGCQVITGKAYINHKNELVDLAKYAAVNSGGLGKYVNGNYQTKGAYTVLSDVVAALSGSENIVRYMLLTEEDLAMSSEVVGMVDGARKMFAGIRWA